jgi:hypothetical protein
MYMNDAISTPESQTPSEASTDLGDFVPIVVDDIPPNTTVYYVGSRAADAKAMAIVVGKPKRKRGERRASDARKKTKSSLSSAFANLRF